MANDDRAAPVFRAGTELSAAQLNAVSKMLISQITGGKGIAVKSFGDKIVVENVAPKTPRGVEILHFKVTAVAEDYLTCTQVMGDGTLVNSGPFTVAKPPILRGDSGTYDVDDIVLAARQVGSPGLTVGDVPVHWEAVHEPSNGGGGTTHDILSATHTDTLAAAVQQGDLMVGNATPKWSRLGLPVSLPERHVLQVNAAGTDPEWTDSLDLAGTLDVTGQATFDSGIVIANGQNIVSGAAGGSTLGTDAVRWGDIYLHADSEIQFRDADLSIWSNADGSIEITADGSLDLNADTWLVNGKQFRFYDVGDSNYVGFQAPALTANTDYILPATDGSSGEYLKTDGAGNLSWDTPGGVTTHDLLSATHTDTLAASVSQGSLVVGNGTPKWAEFPLPVSTPEYSVLHVNAAGTDPEWTKDIQLDSLTMNGDIDFSSGAYDLLLIDNNSQALEIKEGANLYMRFGTSNGSELITFNEKIRLNNTVDIVPDLSGGSDLGDATHAMGYTYTNYLLVNNEVRSNLTMQANKDILAATISCVIGSDTTPFQNLYAQQFNVWKDNALADVNITAHDGTLASRTARFNMRRTRGTHGAEAAVQSGDYLGWFAYYGHDGTSYGYTASVLCLATENWSPGNLGSQMLFSTTLNGASAPSERVRITNDGALEIRAGNELRFRDVGDSNYVGFEAPALTGNQIWVLPDADGSSDEAVITDGAGNLSFGAPTPAAHLHDGDTLQQDGINSDGGAFSFSTTGEVTFNQIINTAGITVDDGQDILPDVTQTSDIGSSSVEFGVGYLRQLVTSYRIYCGDHLYIASGKDLRSNGSPGGSIGQSTLPFDQGWFTNLTMSGAAGTERRYNIATAGVGRWSILGSDDAETGANAGTELEVKALSDAGALIDIPVTIVRAAGGAMSLARPVHFQDGIDFSYDQQDAELRDNVANALDFTEAANSYLNFRTSNTTERLEVTAAPLSLMGGQEQRFYDVGDSNYVGFKAPALTGNQIWTLPTADGTTGQVLKTDGAGNLGWVTASGGNHNILSSTHSDTTVASASTGDLLYYSGTWQRFAVGTAGTRLQVNTSNVPEWKGHEVCRAYLSSSQALGSGVTAKIQFGATTYDTRTRWSGSPNYWYLGASPTRLFRVTCVYEFDQGPFGMTLALWKDTGGGGVLQSQVKECYTHTDVLSIASNDKVWWELTNNSGFAGNIQGGQTITYCTVEEIGHAS